MDRLPKEIVDHIFSFDITYHLVWNKINHQILLNKILESLPTREFLFCHRAYPVDDGSIMVSWYNLKNSNRGMWIYEFNASKAALELGRRNFGYILHL